MTIEKPDFNNVFASQAPDADKPPKFDNYSGGWGSESRPNNGKPTIKAANFIQMQNDNKFLWMHQNGVFPYDSNITYADGIIVIKDGVFKQKNGDKWDDFNKSEITDLDVITESGRTQRNKNKDIVSALDFGIIPNSLDDQTSKFDDFVNYLRINKVKGTVPAGVYILSPTKQRIFGSITESNLETVNYCIDISGINLEGDVQGYRNANGAILKQNPLFVDDKAVMLMQAQQSASMITYNIKGFAFRNAGICLRMTYAVHSNIDHLYWDSTCSNGIILGEFTFDSGPLFNRFTNINGSCKSTPLHIRGKQWCNANVFENFFLTGGSPSIIDVTGGYGALANLFIGGEFKSSADSMASGITIGNSHSTTFLNTYFEADGSAIILKDKARKVSVINPTLGTTRNTQTEGVISSFIYHKEGAASISLDGGSVFLDAPDGLQSNMRLVYSDAPATFQLTIKENPRLTVVENTGWKLIELSNVSQYSLIDIKYTESTPVTFSASGASIGGITSDSNVTYVLNGNMVKVSVDIGLDSLSTLNTGSYYISLLFSPKTKAVGSASYSVSGRRIIGDCSLAQSNRNLFMWIPSVTSVYNDTAKTVASTLTSSYISNANLVGFNSNGSRLFSQISYSIA